MFVAVVVNKHLMVKVLEKQAGTSKTCHSVSIFPHSVLLSDVMKLKYRFLCLPDPYPDAEPLEKPNPEHQASVK